jgi:hypothetical protein
MGRVDYRPIADGSHIYAVDVNFAQTAARAGNGPAIPLVQVAGMQTWIRATLLGYGFEQGNADLEWWEQSAGNHIYDEMVILTAPYTGTKTGEEFYNDDFDQVLSIGGGYEDIQGVAIHCLAPKAASGINEFSVQQDVTAREYYNLQGMKLNKTPENGLYIEKSILTNGSSVSSKIFNVVK